MFQGSVGIFLEFFFLNQWLFLVVYKWYILPIGGLYATDPTF